MNVVFILVLSKVFSGTFESGLITGYLGNLTLLEASFMFLYGSAVDFTSTERWASTLKILKLSTEPRDKKEEKKTSFEEKAHSVPNNTNELNREKKRNTETRAITYVLCGAILLAEIMALALING